jgi:hypothetical protein
LARPTRVVAGARKGSGREERNGITAPLADIGFTPRNIAGFDAASYGDVPLDAILRSWALPVDAAPLNWSVTGRACLNDGS